MALNYRGPAAQILTISAGAALLDWPAALNGFPILFSDTGGMLEMGFTPSMGWDKPFVYGPLLALFSLRWTLWLPLFAQSQALSYLLWLTTALVAPQTPVRHLLLCTALALTTAAPWITSTLMPDVLTPMVPLGLVALTFGPLNSAHRKAVGAIVAVAIAAHLSHLILAATLIAVFTLLRRSMAWRALASLGAAIGFLLASNWIGQGRIAVSPYGSVFALARLIADGPARDYLAEACPQAGYHLCTWQDRLTADSDQFLWDPAGPFWADPTPLPEFAAEASQIVSGTIARYPLRVASDAIRNATTELGRLTLGDTLGSDYLAETIRPRLARWLPADAARFDQTLQARDQLRGIAGSFRKLHLAALFLAAIACAAILLHGLARPNRTADLAALILIALAANAFSTGALSTPHDRYQVRIAWLVLLPPLLWLLARIAPRQVPPDHANPDQAASLATSAGDIRTSDS